MGDQSVGPFSERGAKACDVHLQGLSRRGRGILAPELVDQRICGHTFARMDQQDREQRTLFAPRDGNRPPGVVDFERTEDPEVHALLHEATPAREAAARPSRRLLLEYSVRMPKMKTHSGAKKRFRKSAKGKLLARHSFTSHNLGKKPAKRKRRLGRPMEVTEADRKRVEALLHK